MPLFHTNALTAVEPQLAKTLLLCQRPGETEPNKKRWWSPNCPLFFTIFKIFKIFNLFLLPDCPLFQLSKHPSVSFWYSDLLYFWQFYFPLKNSVTKVSFLFKKLYLLHDQQVCVGATKRRFLREVVRRDNHLAVQKFYEAKVHGFLGASFLSFTKIDIKLLPKFHLNLHWGKDGLLAFLVHVAAVLVPPDDQPGLFT